MLELAKGGEHPFSASMYIDGQWLSGSSGSRISVENPSNEACLGSVPEATADEACAALSAAQQAQKAWARLPAQARANYVLKLAEAVAVSKQRLALILSLEQGKPLDQSQGEVGAAEGFLRYAAENARRIEGDIIQSDNPDEEIWIRSVPRGVVVGLTAWNYPLALAARKLGPALVAGNSFVLLSHENTPFSGVALAELAEAVGIPAGVFNVLTGYGRTVGRALVDSPMSDLITMTGSTRAGKEIYASSASQLKVLRLELGGKAPFIVMEDADIDKAVAAAVTARYANCGQVCTCNERMYLHRDIADEFLEKFIDASKALTIADPLNSPDLGPKISALEVEKIKALVDAGVSAGDTLLLEGGPLNDGLYEKGHWYAPTVVEAASNDSPLIRSEVFGPVVPALRVDDFEHALSLANDSRYGLSAYVFTKDIARMMRLSRDLECGEIYFNRANGEQFQGFHNGWKESGLGGEDGKYGFDGYLKKQTSYINWA